MDELANIYIGTLQECESVAAIETEALQALPSLRQVTPGGPWLPDPDAPRLEAEPIQTTGTQYAIPLVLASEEIQRRLGPTKAAEHANARARCVRELPPGPPEWVPVPPKPVKDKP
jgi:hypothetical protein